MIRRTTRLMLLTLLIAVLAPLAFAGSAEAQAVVWTAQYYNNQTLAGNPVLTRQESSLSLNWGTGSPGPEVNSDGFSARFGTDVVLAPGTYRFFVQADDGVKLFVNYPFQPQIDTYDAPRVGQLLTADVTVSGGLVHIQVDYREVTGDAYLYVTWQSAAGNPTNPNFPVPQQPQTVPVGLTGWTAQYYNNTTLSGTPSLIRGESTPSNNWGAGSPGASISADNFSARWTTSAVLNAGTYRVTVRADDGVRVWVDGVLYIDRFTGFTGQQFTADLNLSASNHNFMVEYVEYGGNAYLEFSFAQTNIPVPPPVVNPPAVNPSGAVATVTTARLNVRQTPNPLTGAILTRISRGESFQVLGQYNTGTFGVWWQLNVNGTVGWVNGTYVNVSNAQLVPVVNPNEPAPVQGVYSGTSRGEVNIRSGPSTAFEVLGRIPRENITVPIIGRNANNTWWRISYNGITGWVSAQWVRIQDGADLNRLPIQG